MGDVEIGAASREKECKKEKNRPLSRRSRPSEALLTAESGGDMPSLQKDGDSPVDPFRPNGSLLR